MITTPALIVFMVHFTVLCNTGLWYIVFAKLAFVRINLEITKPVEQSSFLEANNRYTNNCPTRCNTKQSIYYSASCLYVEASLATLERGSCTKKIWPVPEAVVTVLCTHDGCGWHPKHVEWTFWIINRLLCVASRWTVINIGQRCTEPKSLCEWISLGLCCLKFRYIYQLTSRCEIWIPERKYEASITSKLVSV